jgi:uncharacterized cupredoxin-like copper-binding protein
MRKVPTLIVMAVVVATLSSCGRTERAAAPATTAAPPATVASAQDGADGADGADGGQVAVTVSDFKVALVQHKLPPGKVTFKVVGGGPTAHELVLFRTDLAPTKLPTNPDGTKVDEEGKGVKHVDEVEDVTPGATKQLTVELSPGNYVLLCNLSGHYKLGMTTGLTVG